MTTVLPRLRFFTTEDQMLFSPVEAVIEQEICKIDMAEVTTRRVAPGSSALIDGRTFGFSWGISTPTMLSRSFYGYLEGTTDRTVGTGQKTTNDVMLRMLGTASMMRSKRSRVWGNATIPHVFADICDAHRMNLVTDASTTRWKTIKQDEESDWHLITRLAKKLGWWAHVDGTTLLVLNPDMICSRIPMAERLVPSPHFTQSTEDISGFGTHNAAQRYATWRSEDGATFTFNSSDRVPVTGTVNNLTKIEEEVKIDDAYSLEEATAMFEGVDREASWYIRRTLVTDGRPDLRPLQPVIVRTPQVLQNNRTAPLQGWREYDGVWITEAIKHRLVFGTDASFTTEVRLRRDARGVAPNIRQRRSATKTRFDTLPPTRLLTGRWVAAHRIAS